MPTALQVRTANLSLCGSRLLQREARLFGGEGEAGEQEGEGGRTDAALFKLAVEGIPGLQLLGQKAMIWTEKEAVRKQVALP